MFQTLFQPRLPENFVVYFGFAVLISVAVYFLLKEMTKKKSIDDILMIANTDLTTDVEIDGRCQINKSAFLANVDLLLTAEPYFLKFENDIVGYVERCLNVDEKKAYFMIAFTSTPDGRRAWKLFREKKIKFDVIPRVSYTFTDKNEPVRMITGVRSMSFSR